MNMAMASVNMELVRLALRKVFTCPGAIYCGPPCGFENRRLIEGLTFVEEPKVLRFFFGSLSRFPTGSSNWQRSSARTLVTVCN